MGTTPSLDKTQEGHLVFYEGLFFLRKRSSQVVRGFPQPGKSWNDVLVCNTMFDRKRLHFILLFDLFSCTKASQGAVPSKKVGKDARDKFFLQCIVPNRLRR